MVQMKMNLRLGFSFAPISGRMNNLCPYSGYIRSVRTIRICETLFTQVIALLSINFMKILIIMHITKYSLCSFFRKHTGRAMETPIFDNLNQN